MKPASFAYERPGSVEDAVALLAEHGDAATVLSGGQSLVPMMNLRLARPELLVDIFHLAELDRLGVSDGGLTIGATVTQRTVETSSDSVLGSLKPLRDAARYVGHYPVRTRGTIGGSIAHGDPSAEMPLMAMLLDADIYLRSVTGVRTVSAGSFYRGFLDTDRRDDELLVEVVFPAPTGEVSIVEHARRHGDYGIVLVAVALDLDGVTCRSVRFAIGGVATTPIRLHALEDELVGADLDDDAVEAAAASAAAAVSPASDVQASAAYRRELVESFVRSSLLDLRARQAEPVPIGGER